MSMAAVAWERGDSLEVNHPDRPGTDWPILGELWYLRSELVQKTNKSVRLLEGLDGETSLRLPCRGDLAFKMSA